MSSPSLPRNNKVAETANDAGQSIREKVESFHDAADCVDHAGEKSDLNDSAYFPGKSRYGRTIKPKSPRDDIAEFPKNYKMPKTRKSQNSSENSNENIDESNIVNDTDEASDSFSSSNSMEEIASPKFDNNTAQCNWSLGQLAWARVGNFPFWPCVVTLDPTSLIFYKYKATGRSQLLMIHVQYFGDKGRHSWVSSNSMIHFTNLDDFQKLSESLTAEIKRKDAKYAAAFVIKPGLKIKWETAVEEATEVQPMTDQERADIFKPIVKSSRQKVQKTLDFYVKGKTSKRKYAGDPNTSDAKRTKQESVDVSEKLQYKLESPKLRYLQHENGKANLRLNFESPSRISVKSNESNSDSSTTQKNDFKSDELDGVFEVYYERNRDMLEDEHPDLSEEEIKKYLRKTWNDMNSSFRRKYRLYIKSEDNQSKENTPESEEDTSTDAESITKDIKKLSRSNTVETKKTRPYNLFKGMKQEKVCQICEKTGKLTRCRGPCYSYFHLSCVKPGESSPEHSIDESTYSDKLFDDLREIKRNNTDDEENSDKAEEQEDESFKCIDCLSGVAPACFVCNEREGDRIRCSVLACGKHYHSSCLKSWPQSRWQGGRLTCPYHMCHTCSSDNPQDSHSRAPNEKIARCVRCPSSYHTSISCLPAGSVILTGSQIVCPKHYKAPHPPLNAAWCFLCTRGGSLICCDTCPTSFHLECLGINAPDGAFICEDCETGRLPLYGEVVWVKLGNYRWWPSRICYPHEIPENVEAIPHSPGKFCVMFLGSNNYYWVHRGRAFLYQDGDANIKPSSVGKRKMRNDTYRKALEEASEIHQRLKTERAAAKDHESKGLKPPPYVKLKVNKPVGNVKPVEVESIVACDCDAELDDACAPGTDCLNRILLIECSPGVCPAGTKCNNQDFVRRQYPAMEPFHTVGRGWGLRSLEAIKSGQFIIEYVGEVIDEAEYKERLSRKKELKNENFYFLTIDNNRMIDAEPKGNLSRFMNHSCSPNCETQKWTVNGDTRIGLFALRDIKPREELTFNYNLACDGETRKACLCGASNCSGFIGLKVQKPQVTPVPVPSKKSDKAEKVRRQRRSRKHFCWSCGQEIMHGSETIVCDHKTCNKKYHNTCVDIDNGESKFSCPWHHCIECNRRTSAHCSFCSVAFCQVHLDGNLFEYGEKSGFVCALHENMEIQRSSAEDEKDSSDNEADIDKEYLSRSSSPIEMETKLQREPSPRVSIVEVHPNSEESEESQKEEDEELLEDTIALCTYNFSKTVKRKMLNQSSNMFEEEQAEKLNNLTSSQLEAIIGGSLFE
ncbi:histone-lysine N-methyltransferase NSD2-like isoform X1 [Vespa mandarinia]|uniref:histone-lysine N-methyltransferase NSD2 n=2 Tax=Vespa TaxID=7443 RepID=UPI001607A194|nr:histone-lysine N-methyltransferase NSD2-like isoform X1 [Vespa mandarinia]XP_047346159.1 histone-lysine N-methyltransferase NSD2 [Vespa velutina]XP_047346160.1 histone-lysine N-methyltransferase NSD2 [Vespa velutina]